MADDTVMEEREELMVVSPSSGEVHFRKANFLKPSATSAAAAAASPNPSAATSCEGSPIKVNFFVWACKRKWKTWVTQMRFSHQSTWKRAGIFDAIISSTYTIPRCEDLILGLAEKWSPKTNSFVFPWGEATITLEDMMVLGAFSVLGEPVFIPPRDEEMENKVTKLLESRVEIYNSTAKRACLNRWITKFMGSGSEIEQEAFLAYWLSKFVFPFLSSAIGKTVLPIAVHLARGTRIALAPAVLASIYRALTLLKERDSISGPLKRKRNFVVLAPLAFVQVWAWERLPLLRPNPKRVGENEPRIARWAGWSIIRSSTTIVPARGEDCRWRWRPYRSDGVYMDDERWEAVENEELESFVRCVRVSKLVGLGKGCIEQYLPHRVAMQFGMDQDLPAHVAALGKVDPEIAWSDFIRPVGDAKIYVPSRLYQPCVTSRYFKWWKKLKGEGFGMAPAIMEQLQDEVDVDVEATSEQLEDEMDDDEVPLRALFTRCTSGVKNAKSAFGGKGRSQRSKRRYLQLFPRQRNEFVSVPQRDAQRHSAVFANGSKSPEKGSENSKESSEISEKSSNSLKKLMPAPSEAFDLSSKSLEKSSRSLEKFMRAPMEASDLARGCEIDGKLEDRGENCLFPENSSKYSEKSSESLEKLMPASDSGGGCHIVGKHEGKNCLVSEKSSVSLEKSPKNSDKLVPAPMKATPMEASDSGRGCEIEGKREAQGENNLFSGANIVQLSEATVDRAEEKIGSEKNSKNSKKSSLISEKSYKCSEKMMPAPVIASESGCGCEIEGKHEGEGENRLFSGARNEIVVQLSEARKDSAEEKIDSGGFEERVRNIEEIFKLIRAGTLVVNKFIP